MWKIREITDKVTNVVMNYSEVEAKVREATNDDAWGPHGSLMNEVAQYTFTYEHFPEVMGMLWKRMLHDNKKNWRRVYKSLILLTYLVRNGSERVVTSSREHIYDLRALENYTFTDENGKDQGLNVRHKCKDLLGFIQDDDKIRDERKKAKKTKDKFVGVSGEATGYNSYSDRYEEEPRRTKKLDDIDDWGGGKKSIANEAVDRVKDVWNKVTGRRGGAEAPDFYDDDDRGSRYDDRVSRYDDYRDRNKDKDKDRDRDVDNDDDYSEKDRDRPRDRDRYEYKDDDENEFTSVERTHTTRTEKITTNRRSRQAKKIDLGAASTFGKDADSVSVNSTNVENAPSLIDMGHQQKASESSFADFSGYQCANANGSFDDFNPRAATTPQSAGQPADFGDFAQFQNGGTVSSPTGSANFADFSQMNSANSPTSPVSGTPAVSNTAAASNDLFDMFGSTSPQSTPIQPMQTASNLMSSPAQAPTSMMPTQPAMGTTSPMMSTPPMGMGMPVKPGMGPRMGTRDGTTDGTTDGDEWHGTRDGDAGPDAWADANGDDARDVDAHDGPAAHDVAHGNGYDAAAHADDWCRLRKLLHAKFHIHSHAADLSLQNYHNSTELMPLLVPGSLDTPTSDPSSAGPQTPKKINTWSESKVDISLDTLNPANRFQKQAQPSMNQLQQQGMMGTGVVFWYPEINCAGMGGGGAAPAGAMYTGQSPAMMGGMSTMNQGMANMSVGAAPRMMSPQPMMGTGMGMQPGMMGGMPQGSMGMQSTTVSGQSSFQKRTDSALASFGNVK
ncbi:clathrin interactor 1-like [Haliotis rubra]|uniref:clathrin interactor 1-like n=1 Tax=Haliotis rubra TaxID=36100 RepID=UPI001EE6209A|nr:clathrin interactor 1-like [Haliotis rubra]